MFLLKKLFKRPSWTALDIQNDALRLLQLATDQKKCVVEKIDEIPLEAGLIVDGKIQHAVRVSQLIRQMTDRNHLLHSKIVIALSGQNIISKQIKLPAVLQPEECEVEINHRLSHYLPGVTEEVYFDFIIVGTAAEYHDVSLVAARRHQLEAFVNVVLQAGLIVKAVDIDSYALKRAVSFFLPQASFEKIVVVLDLRPTDILLVIYRNHQVILNHYFSINKNPLEFCQQVKHALQLYFSSYFTAIDHWYLSRFPVEIIECLQQEFSKKMTVIDVYQKLMIADEIPVSLTLAGLAIKGVAND